MTLNDDEPCPAEVGVLLESLATGLEQLRASPAAVLIQDEIEILQEFARQAVEAMRGHAPAA